MYSTLRSSNLAEYQLPELKRCPLDELCLQVKLLEGASAVSDVREFLHKAVEPPVDKAVSQAVSLLQVRLPPHRSTVLRHLDKGHAPAAHSHGCSGAGHRRL